MPTVTLLSLLVALALPLAAQTRPQVLHAALGPELSTYKLDVNAATLEKISAVTLPENVQEAWPHPTRRYLYVAWSNNTKGGHHGLTAFEVDAKTGALKQHGQPVTLPARTVYLTLDIPGKHVICASNDPSGATVHRINADGTLGSQVAQPSNLDFGVYAHQVRVDPTNRMVIIVARGNGPTAKTKEDPGALKVYGYNDGVLSNRASIAPNGGYGFQPRHLEFHPSRSFAYITVERQNKLQAYRVIEGPSLKPEPLFTAETLVDVANIPKQATSSIHAHPNGRYLYVGNRGPAGGENSVAVYALNGETGEPTRIQNADTQGVHPRTFALDATGRLLVVANMQRAGAALPNLAVFRIGADGKLTFVRKYEHTDAGERSLFWTGILPLP
ncbi:MAG: beta-propeller fold lactonase family protein [Bryobacterales bacterium]|nr:beta-propeller fold lactonase family protein [Bryobacterales bacterium]